MPVETIGMILYESAGVEPAQDSWRGAGAGQLSWPAVQRPPWLPHSPEGQLPKEGSKNREAVIKKKKSKCKLFPNWP